MILKQKVLSGIRYLCYHGYLKWLPNEAYIKLLFYGTFGKCANLKSPQNYNEKLQWLKLHAMKPEYQNLVDKYEVKKYVTAMVGEKYVIPTLAVWNSVDEIDFEELPDQFVLKTTHDSGSVVICRHKKNFNKEAAIKILRQSMKKNYYDVCREPQYKNIVPRIIAESYIAPQDCADIDDYKMMCFNGKFDNVMICSGRHSDRGIRYYHFDKDWKFLPYVYYDDLDEMNFVNLCPQNYDEMIKIANALCKGFPHIRVDLYNVNGKIYFGELTFFQAGGFDDDLTEEAKDILGSKILLPEKI